MSNHFEQFEVESFVEARARVKKIIAKGAKNYQSEPWFMGLIYRFADGDPKIYDSFFEQATRNIRDVVTAVSLVNDKTLVNRSRQSYTLELHCKPDKEGTYPDFGHVSLINHLIIGDKSNFIDVNIDMGEFKGYFYGTRAAAEINKYTVFVETGDNIDFNKILDRHQLYSKISGILK